MSYSDSFFCEEPPTVKGSGDRCQQQGPLATVVTSSTAQQVTNIPQDAEAFVTFTFTQDARIHFGDANVAAADANSALMRAGKHRFRVQYLRRYFRVIRDTADGSMSWWVSNRV